MFGVKQKKFNIDDLYEDQRRMDQKKIAIYSKKLDYIYLKIKEASKKNHRDYIYHVPFFYYGESVYRYQECMNFLIDRMTSDGFTIQTEPPNVIHISWENWIPRHIREELKKKNIHVDPHGNPIETAIATNHSTNPLQTPASESAPTSSKYRSVNLYRPNQSIVYDEDLLKVTEERLKNNIK